jgi:hypothetical protein
MSTTYNNGGPAFPVPPPVCSGPNNSWEYAAEGMSLRDWFAGQALQGLCVDRSASLEPEAMAYWCYRYANAMLAERAKPKGGSA